LPAGKYAGIILDFGRKVNEKGEKRVRFGRWPRACFWLNDSACANPPTHQKDGGQAARRVNEYLRGSRTRYLAVLLQSPVGWFLGSFVGGGSKFMVFDNESPKAANYFKYSSIPLACNQYEQY
jgi:hypothetical protein